MQTTPVNSANTQPNQETAKKVSTKNTSRRLSLGLDRSFSNPQTMRTRAGALKNKRGIFNLQMLTAYKYPTKQESSTERFLDARHVLPREYTLTTLPALSLSNEAAAVPSSSSAPLEKSLS
jgi:hypothetical protein